MIRLTINGQDADLKPSTTITITDKRDIFNLSVIGGSFSLPFDLAATAKNRKIFGYIDDPSSKTNFEKEYPAQLEFCGAINLVGVFVLRNAKQKTNLNGYFKTNAGALSEFSKTNIKEIIGDLEEFTVNNLTEIYNQNATPTNNFLFPKHVQILTVPNNNKGGGTVESTRSLNPPQLPVFNIAFFRACVKIQHIIFLVFQSLGYEVSYNFSDYAFERAIWISSNQDTFKTYISSLITSFPMTWKVKDLVPNITLTEFLSSLRANFNLKITILPNSKLVTFDLVKDTILGSSIDLTKYVGEAVTIESIDDTTENDISFSVDPQNEIDTTNLLAPVVNYAAAIGAPADENKIRIVELECRYYQVVALFDPIAATSDYQYVPYALGTVPKTIFGLTKPVESKLSPIPNEQVHFRNFQQIQLTNNGGGKCRLAINGDGLLGTDSPSTTEIRLIGDDISYNKKFVSILASTGTHIDIDINYIEDETVDFQSRRDDIYVQPVLESAYEESEGGISMYHKVANTTDISNTYGYASSSVYDTDSVTVLSNAAFIFDTGFGLFSQYYEDVVNKFGGLVKKSTISAWLPIFELLKINVDFIVVNGVKYLINKFKIKLSNRTQERVQSTIEGRIS